MAQPPKDTVGERRLQRGNSIQFQKAREVARVALFLRDEEPYRGGIVRVRRTLRIGLRAPVQIPALRTLARLKFLNRLLYIRSFFGTQVTAAVPGNVQKRLRIAFVVLVLFT